MTITVHHLEVRLETGADRVMMAVHVTIPPPLTDGENVTVVTTPHVKMRIAIILTPVLAIITIIAEAVKTTLILIAIISNLANLTIVTPVSMGGAHTLMLLGILSHSISCRFPCLSCPLIPWHPTLPIICLPCSLGIKTIHAITCLGINLALLIA